MRQWQMRIERAQYEAALAEQRYQECDPANRLVAGTLERRWNDALLRLESSKTEAANFKARRRVSSRLSKRPKSSHWPAIYHACGMLRRHKRRIASVCYGSLSEASR